MRFGRFSKYVLIFAGLHCGAQPALAAIVAYTDRASFMGAVSAAAIDTFDDQTPGTVVVTSGLPPAAPLVRSVGPYTYGVSGAFKTLEFTGTAADVFLRSSGIGQLFFSSFGGNPYAVGADIFNEDSFGNVVPGTIAGGIAVNAAGEQLLFESLMPTTFLGFVSTASPISSLISWARTPSSPISVTSVNNFTLAGLATFSVPLPGTPVLVLTGLLLMMRFAPRGKPRLITPLRNCC